MARKVQSPRGGSERALFRNGRKWSLTHCFCYPMDLSSSFPLPSHGRSRGALQLCGRSRSHGSKMSADNVEKRVGRVAWHICGTRTMQFNCRVWAWTWHHAILECLLVLQREGWIPDTVGGKLTGRPLKLPHPLYSLDPFQVSLGIAPRLLK